MSRNLNEKFLRKKKIFKGHAISFRVDAVRLPNGKTAYREYVEHPGAGAVVALTKDGGVVLVRQYRHPIGKVTYEIPAGKLDGGERPLACIRRELQEETGYTAGRFRHLVTFWPAPAFSNEALHIYFADKLKSGVNAPDEDEFIEPVVVPFARALSWIKSGKIQDAKTVIGLLACAQYGLAKGRRR